MTNQLFESESFDPTLVVRIRIAKINQQKTAAIELSTGQIVYAIGGVEDITHMINTERLEPMG